MAFDPKSLTVDFTSLSKVPTQVRQNAYAQGLIPEEFLSQLTPTQLANLFPKYFSKGLPDVSGFRGVDPESETFDERVRRVSGGAAPTATEAPVSRPSGTSQPTVASQNQQAQQAEQAQQGLAGILAPYMPQQAATGQREGKQYKANEKAGELQKHIIRVSNNLGLNPKDLATLISYETAGSMNPYKKGQRTQWGVHRGLIQWGEVQARKYGLDLNPNSPNRSSIEQQMNAVEQYFKDEGFVDWMKKNPNAPLIAVRRAMYATVNAGNPERVNASDAQNGGAPGTVIDKVNEMFRTKGYTHYNKAEKFLKDAIEEVTTPTAEEFQEATAQPASKNVFKLDKEKLRESAKKSNLLAGLASDEKIDSEINKKIQSLLPEGASYNPETGEITGNLSIDDIKSIVKEKAPEFGDQISEYIQPVGQPLISAAQDELAVQAEAVPTVAMSDEVKTFISELPEQAREELSKDPKLVAGIDAAIKAGAGDNIKQQITQKYTEKSKPTATEIKEAIDSGQDPYAFWNARNPRGAKLQLGSREVSKELLTTAMMAAQKFEAENPGKRVEIYGPNAGIRKGSGGSMHKRDGAIDLAIFEIDKDGNYIKKSGAYGNYPNYPGHAGGKKGSAAAAHLYDRLNEDIELARFYKHSVEGDTNYAYGTRIGTYFSDVQYDQMHTDIKAGLNKMGISNYSGPGTGSVAYGMSENWLKRYGIDPSSPEGQEMLTGVVEKYGGTKEGITQAAIAAYGPAPSNQQVQAQAQTQSAPDTSGNIIPQAGGTPTPEQAAAQAQATATEASKQEEDKSLWQKAKDWVTGSDNSSEAPLAYGADMIARPGSELRISDGKGKEHVVGEAGAEKVSVESKYDPQEQNKKMETYQQQSQSKLSLPESMSPVDFEKTSTGAYDTPTSMRDAINYSKFAQGGFSRHLYLNGSKNVV